MSTTSDNTVADPERIIADLQHQLAECKAERDEALEQQTAIAEVLGAINASPGDLTPVFDAILDRAMRLCRAVFGLLYTRDADHLQLAAHKGVPSIFAELRREHGLKPLTGGDLERAYDTKRPVQVLDVAAPRVHEHQRTRQFVIAELGGARTLLAAPLVKDENAIGHIALYRREVEAFTDRQVALLQSFAAQAVVAMENARLFTETREALEQQTATAEVLGVINSSPGDLAPVFDTMLERAVHLCNAGFGALHTFDGEAAHTVAVHNLPQPFAEYHWAELRRFHPAGLFGRAIHQRRTTHVADAAAEESYLVGVPTAVAAVELGGVRTLIHVPLIKEDHVLGVFSICRHEVRPFSDKQIALLQNFAAQAVIAMENARLISELRERTEQVAELNRGLELQVAEQVEELRRVGRLKRFLAPQLAELIVSQRNEKILESHRREIVVVFCDLRGYTAFTETAEPEEVLDLLREYHGALGPLVSQFEGTLDQFSGDGIMVFFNDPVPIPDPAVRAISMAVAMREAAGTLIADWRERGRDLGFGAGIAQGYATLGQIGFSERSGYTAIGTVCNVAARLCAEAKDGQILLSQRVNVALRGKVVTEQVGPLALKGLTQPTVAYNVPLAANQPALRVIEGGPQSH